MHQENVRSTSGDILSTSGMFNISEEIMIHVHEYTRDVQYFRVFSINQKSFIK